MRDSMGLELWMGNNGYDLRWTSDDLHPLHDAQELADYNTMGELAYMDHKSQQAKAYIHAHPAWYAWMCVRRAVYLWTGYWSFNRDYLALEPMDPANIPFATALTLLALLGLLTAWRKTPFEAIRYGGVLFLFPDHVLLHPSRAVPSAPARPADGDPGLPCHPGLARAREGKSCPARNSRSGQQCPG